MAKKEPKVTLTRLTTPLPPEQVYAFRYALEKLAGLVNKVRAQEKALGESEAIEHSSRIQPEAVSVPFSTQQL